MLHTAPLTPSHPKLSDHPTTWGPLCTCSLTFLDPAGAAPDTTFRDVILAVRADEAHHRRVNHTFAGLDERDYNPYVANKQVSLRTC